MHFEVFNFGKECTTPYKETRIQKKSSILDSKCWDYFAGGCYASFMMLLIQE